MILKTKIILTEYNQQNGQLVTNSSHKYFLSVPVYKIYWFSTTIHVALYSPVLCLSSSVEGFQPASVNASPAATRAYALARDITLWSAGDTCSSRISSPGLVPLGTEPATLQGISLYSAIKRKSCNAKNGRGKTANCINT